MKEKIKYLPEWIQSKISFYSSQGIFVLEPNLTNLSVTLEGVEFWTKVRRSLKLNKDLPNYKQFINLVKLGDLKIIYKATNCDEIQEEIVKMLSKNITRNDNVYIKICESDYERFFTKASSYVIKKANELGYFLDNTNESLKEEMETVYSIIPHHTVAIDERGTESIMRNYNIVEWTSLKSEKNAERMALYMEIVLKLEWIKNKLCPKHIFTSDTVNYGVKVKKDVISVSHYTYTLGAFGNVYFDSSINVEKAIKILEPLLKEYCLLYVE